MSVEPLWRNNQQGVTVWIREEIRRAIKVLDLSATELANTDLRDTFEALATAFAEPGSQPLWERLKERTSIHDPNGWRRIRALATGPLWLLVEDSQGRCGFAFRDASDLELVLQETSGFVFYVTDPDLTYLISFNDHDFLIASGAVSIK